MSLPDWQATKRSFDLMDQIVKADLIQSMGTYVPNNFWASKRRFQSTFGTSMCDSNRIRTKLGGSVHLKDEDHLTES